MSLHLIYPFTYKFFYQHEYMSESTPPIRNPSLKLVKLHGSILDHTAKASLVNEVILCVRDAIPNLSELRSSIELVEHVCILVENKDDQSKKIDKKAVVLAVFGQIFPELAAADKQAELSRIIDFVCASSKYLKKIPSYEKLGRSLFAWIAKKV